MPPKWQHPSRAVAPDVGCEVEPCRNFNRNADACSSTPDVLTSLAGEAAEALTIHKGLRWFQGAAFGEPGWGRKKRGATAWCKRLKSTLYSRNSYDPTWEVSVQTESNPPLVQLGSTHFPLIPALLDPAFIENLVFCLSWIFGLILIFKYFIKMLFWWWGFGASS